MTGIPIGSFENRDKDRTISREEYAKLLDACPNQEWRTIIALARIGGLRCPSELKQLRWPDVSDVDFSEAAGAELSIQKTHAKTLAMR